MNHYKPLSRFFPAYHPRKGEPTFFVEQFYRSMEVLKIPFGEQNLPKLDELNPNLNYTQLNDFLLGFNSCLYATKHHTIRAGNKVKVGDTIQFFCWLGKPYRSKQIKIAPPIEVKKVWEFGIGSISHYIYVKGQGFYPDYSLEKIAKNDGLSAPDLLAWLKYPKPFTGQIICWSSDICY